MVTKKVKSMITITIIDKNHVKRKTKISKDNKIKYEYNRYYKAYQKLNKQQIKIKREEYKKKHPKKVKPKKVKPIKEKKPKKIKDKIIKGRKPVKKPIDTEKEKEGYELTIFEFECHAGQSGDHGKVKHLFSIRTDDIDLVVPFHDANYPHHDHISYEAVSTRFIEYGKPSYAVNVPTQPQIDLLLKLGYNKNKIKGMTKVQASEEIKRLSR